MAVVINGTTGITTPTESVATTIGVGGATPSASGAGITFPATQSASSNANTLDDYEEGTWTPDVNHDSSNNSTWSSKSGTYRKIGSVVHCWFQCDGGNSGTGGSQLTVLGLPFTPTTTPSNVSFGIWGANGSTPNVGNIFNAGGTPKLYNGGNNVTTQISYVSGYFSYVS